MSEPKSDLNDLLNRAEALLDCKAGTATELAKFLGKPIQRVTEWLRLRKNAPNGQVTLNLLEWVQNKEWEVTHKRSKLLLPYFEALLLVLEERSVAEEN